ncbi:MAG TPA: thiamine pyrophosphate-binding protein [Chloroflexota bacterium]|nr:thiamine pyrophosphate-binding protein [Chloroflexota bacterium]
MATTVEVMVEAFKEAGTPFIVGHPGGESVELMEAARQREVRFIFVKQESAGAFLASTWGDLTGAPGVCFSTRAPGAANMVNGVTHAWMDRSPLIAITDQYPAHTYATSLRQRLNQLDLYRTITKWNATISARTVHQLMRRAMRTATAFPPGPVQFDLPADETTREAAQPVAPVPVMPTLPALHPDRRSLQPALDRLSRARRPVVLAGMGVLWDRASAQLRALAEQLGAPVLTTAKAKGVIPDDHPLRAGVLIGGLIEREIVSQADLIVAVGLDPVELQPKPWPYSLPVLGLSNTPNLDGVVPADPELVGRLGPLLEAIAEYVPAGSGWGEAAAGVFRRQVSKSLDLPTRGLAPQRVVELTRQLMPRETIATVDSGAHRLLVVQKWQAYGPREFLSSNGLATMGYALPGALAARLAFPNRPVVCFTGDGGFLMAVAELQTAVREGLRLVVVVFDDGEIGLIRVKQEIKGLPLHGVQLGGLDYEKLAQGCGADGVVVDSEAGLSDALGAALRSDGVTVIAARIDKSAYVEQFNALREL